MTQARPLEAKGWSYPMPADARDRARQVETARRDVVAWLVSAGVPADSVFDLEVILGEAASNVARHSGSRVMRVTVSAAAGAACLTVEDEGSGFDPGAVPEPDMVSESGRGLWLMRSLAETVITSRAGLTHVQARKEWAI